MRKAIICFTRVPRPGKTKTRLMPALSPEQCAGLHWAFLRDLAGIYAGLEADLFVAYTEDPDWEALMPLFPTARFFPQQGADLGAKMDHAIRHVLALRYDAAVLTGSDLPAMTADHLRSGFAALEEADLAIGPTPDGGYYLVGTKVPCTPIFENQRYGGSTVYENTLAAARRAGFTAARAMACGDVDTPKDLGSLQVAPGSHTGQYLDTLRKEGVL